MNFMKLGNVLIYGDSYSTYESYIPEGYACYYTPRERSGAPFLPSVENTWWYPIVTREGNALVENNSWSGSTVCHTGWHGADTSKTSSFLCRLEKHIAEGFFQKKKIDTVFVFGLTNDIWSGAPLGEAKYENFEEKDLFFVLPAIAYMVKRLREATPDSRVVWVVNSGVVGPIADVLRESCARFGADALFLSPFSKEEGHPTAEGMRAITAQIDAFLG